MWPGATLPVPGPFPDAASQPQSDRANPAHGQQDLEAPAEGD